MLHRHIIEHVKAQTWTAVALELGTTVDGTPGLRAAGGEGCYAACCRDLDGNKPDVFSYDFAIV